MKCASHAVLCCSNEWTALHVAVKSDDSAACKLLIAAKADVNARDWCAFMFKIYY